MRINIQNTADGLLKFLNHINESADSSLVSFAFKVDEFNILNSINALTNNYSEIFFFQSPASKYSLVALNNVLKISNDHQSNISELKNEFDGVKSTFINNWNDLQLDSLPYICTSLKFDSNKNSEDWEDFKPMNIYIPELMFYSNNGKTFGSFNFIKDKSHEVEKYSNYLIQKLNQLKELSTGKEYDGNGNNEYQFDESKNEVDSWLDVSDKAIEYLKEKKVRKLVLSRSLSFYLKHTPDWKYLLNKLYKRFPDCYLFFVKQNESHFFGSSPEMFLKVFGNLAEVESVAGSAPRGNKFESDELFEQVLQASKKNHKEHEYVTEFISDTLNRFSDKVIIKEEKSIKKLDNIQHLATRITAELKSDVQILTVINALFPTPAVCGLPKEEAMSIIRNLETHDRGLYSGLIGWLNFDGDCELAVAIRSTLVKNNKVIAYAGAGLVKDSIPEEEFLETKLKLDPILSLFRSKGYSQK